MKIKKMISAIAALSVATSAFAALSLTSYADNDVLYNYDFTTGETVYSNDFTATESYDFDDNQTPAGWTIAGNDSVSGQKLKVTANNSSHAIFAPMLQSGKKYAITWDVSDLSTTSSATYQYITTLMIGGTTVNYPICYQPNGTWSNVSGHTYVTSSAMNMIIFDTSTGKYDAYSRISEDADTIWKKSGTISATTDFKIEYYSWGSGFSIDNVAVTDITGWTISEQSKIKFSSNQLKISSAGSDFNGSQTADTVYNLNALDSNTTYKISWDGMSGGQWTGIELANINTYTEYNIFQSDSKVFAPSTSLPSGTVPTMIELNTGTGVYTVKINGSSVKTGSLTANSQYQINFHTSGNNFYYTIDNFKVEKVVAANTANWTLTNAAAESNRLAIGSDGVAELDLSALEANSIYDIEWDWIGNSGDNWLDFGVYSGTESYQIAEKFNNDTQTAALHYNGVHSLSTVSTSNKITLNTKTGEWTVYVNGDEKISGATAEASGYSFKLHSWADVTHYIDNVTVTKTGTVDEPPAPTAAPVKATAKVTGANDDNTTYKIGLQFDNALNPSDYEYIVFQAMVDGTAQQKGGKVSEVIGSFDGDTLIAIILDNAPSRDVSAMFTNASIGID